ncbi:MAG: ThiF family adenylyltransferase [Promethearchaeota archaeon]
MNSNNISNFTSKALSNKEKRLFDRQLRLPGWNQELLKRSKVLIAGIGGLGVEVAKNLAMVGIGHLILVDMDTIEYSNMNRQLLFVGAPEGASKAKIAAEKLREINPFIRVEAYNCMLQDIPPYVYQDSDIYIAGLDSIEARAELNRRAVHNRKPLIDAGTAAYNGHIYTVFPFKNACLECDPLRDREQDDLGACTLVGEPRRPSHCIIKGQLYFEDRYGRTADILNPDELGEVLEYANKLLQEHFSGAQPFTADQVAHLIEFHEPTVITINCVMASLQSQEAVKILHHHNNPQSKKLGSLQLNYTIYNGLTGKFYEIEKPVNPNCSLCGSDRTPLYKIRVKPGYSLINIISKITREKNLVIDPEFPPTIFRIDSSEVTEINLDQTISKAALRSFETILVTGFEEDKQFYLQIQLEV